MTKNSRLIFILLIIITLQFLNSCISDSHVKNNEVIVNELDAPLIQNELLGVKWCGSNNEPSFQILQDSIYFIDQMKSYPYKLDGTEFSIKFPDRDSFVVWGKSFIVSDTLFFESEDGSILKAIRCK